MKIRTDFVTNSSSSSFVAVLDAVLENGESIRAVDDDMNGGQESGTIIVHDATGKMSVGRLRYVENLQDVIVRYDGKESRIVSGVLSLKCCTYGEYIWEANPETIFNKYTMGNAYKTVKSYMPARYSKDRENKLIAEKEHYPDLARLSDSSVRTLVSYVYKKAIESDTEIIQSFAKDGTETIRIVNGERLFDTNNDWRFSNDIPNQCISLKVKKKPIDAVPEKSADSSQNGDISRYIPEGVMLTETQMGYLKAAIELLANQEHVKMVDVARYMGKSTGSTGEALKKLRDKGILSISDEYEISLK